MAEAIHGGRGMIAPRVMAASDRAAASGESTSSDLGVRRATWLAGVLCGMLVIAIGPALDLYHGSLAGQALCGAIVAGVLVSLGLRRAPAASVAPASAALLAAYTLAVVWLSARASHLPAGLPHLTGDALRGGIARMLGSLLPMEAEPDTLAVPIIVVWLASMATAELALRAGRMLAAYTAPTLLYAAALVFAGPHSSTAWWRPIAFVALAVVGLMRGAGRARAVSAGAAVVAVCAAVAPVVTANVAPAPDFHRAPPPRDRTLDENPLIRLSGWNLEPAAPLFRASITGVPAGTPVRLRLAVLPVYDGVTWRVDGDYRAAGTVLASRRGRVTARVRVDELDGDLLPAPDNPTAISGLRVAFDPSTGTLLRPDGLAAGLSYTVEASPTAVDSGSAQADDVPSGPPVARYLALPGTPPETMLRLARQIGTDASSPYERADGIAEFLRDHYRLAGDAPSGHAYPNLDFFLFASRAAGGQKGSSEQFAAAFAVLARMLGLPSRVVVGFDTTAPSSTVRGGDAIAWPEVLFDGAGWVPFDPLPNSDEPLRNVEDDFAAKVTPPSTPPIDVPAPSDEPSARPTASPEASAASAGAAHVSWPLLGAISMALLLAVLTVAAIQRGRERRAWSGGPPARRVAHAWWAVHESMRRAGHRAPAHLDASAVASHAARLAEVPLDTLVAAVNATVFGAAELGDHQVESAQSEARAYIAALHSRRRKRTRPRRPH